MNDAQIARSSVERIDWQNIIHLIQSDGVLMDSAVISPDGTEHKFNRALTHTNVDRRRKVAQHVVITMTESAVGES